MPNLFGVRLFREPDAGNPPVRFDEREEETELSQTGLRRRGESPANRHRKATVTAPLLDSTLCGATLFCGKTVPLPAAQRTKVYATEGIKETAAKGREARKSNGAE